MNRQRDIDGQMNRQRDIDGQMNRQRDTSLKIIFDFYDEKRHDTQFCLIGACDGTFFSTKFVKILLFGCGQKPQTTKIQRTNKKLKMSVIILSNIFNHFLLNSVQKFDLDSIVRP